MQHHQMPLKNMPTTLYINVPLQCCCTQETDLILLQTSVKTYLTLLAYAPQYAYPTKQKSCTTTVLYMYTPYYCTYKPKTTNCNF